jgi:GNAT superfamily N-acetyltransferase
MPPARRALVVRDVTPADWHTVESLFGSNGACGGCWCMWSRLPRGGKLWEERKGEPNRRALRELVLAGRVHAVLALRGGTPVGWCCLGPREDFPRLLRVRALPSQWEAGTWSVVCFFIPAAWRRQGVAGALLGGAVALARRRGARALEGYPVPVGEGRSMPATFAWTGVPRLFRAAGFSETTAPGATRPVFRRRLRAGARR